MTQAVTTTQLPPNWALFVDAVAGGADPVGAAKGCNYAEPKATAALLLRHPDVRKALVEASEAWLQWRGLQLAHDVVEEIMTDRDPKAKAVRAKMAIALLDRNKAKEDKAPAGERPLHELTPAELAAEIAKLRANSPPAPQMRDVTPGREGGEVIDV